MKKTLKTILIVFCLTVILFIITPIKAQAALQSNGGTPATKSLNGWMLQVRNMQALGGTLGRTDTINTTNLTSNATDLDIHMEKNTEYGAMAILSASSYGNPNKITSGQTTTGNETGIVINLNKEWVAAGQLEGVPQFVNANGRYKNAYTRTYSAKIGDAITETKGWHGSTASTWLSWNKEFYPPTYGYTPQESAGLLRSYSRKYFFILWNVR